MAHHKTNNDNIFFHLCILSVFLVISATASPEMHRRRHQLRTSNFRDNQPETPITPSNLPELQLQLESYAGKDTPATTVIPALYNGMIYIPSWNGYLYAVNIMGGSVIWKKNLDEVTSGLKSDTFRHTLKTNTTVSLATPVVAGDVLIVGIYAPAVVFALNRLTGDLLWSTQIDSHPTSVITMSGTYYDRAFYIGTSSLGEGLTVANCCTYRGSLAKLDACTGAILWKTFMLPENHNKTGEYAGAALWGNDPLVDPQRKLIYIATGNLYSAPKHVFDCQERWKNATSPKPYKCNSPEDCSNSILAIDMDSGKIKWRRHELWGYDMYSLAWINSLNPKCPATEFEVPMMEGIYINGTTIRDIVVARHTSGFTLPLDRDTGELVLQIVVNQCPTRYE